MGRQGLPSFLLDTEMDEKWELLEARFGLKGFAIAVKLLQRIYGGEGYYCEWNEDISLVFARRVGADASLVSNIVDYLVRRGLFDEEKFSNLGILTSAAIQKHYLQTKRRAIEVVLEGSFLCDYFSEDVYKNLKIVYRNQKNVSISPISKVNESKVKESKNITPIRHKYGEYGHVLLTDDQYQKLVDEYPNHAELIEFLDEYIELKGYKAKNHYLAIKKWVVQAVQEKNARIQKQREREAFPF